MTVLVSIIFSTSWSTSATIILTCRYEITLAFSDDAMLTRSSSVVLAISKNARLPEDGEKMLIYIMR